MEVGRLCQAGYAVNDICYKTLMSKTTATLRRTINDILILTEYLKTAFKC